MQASAAISISSQKHSSQRNDRRRGVVVVVAGWQSGVKLRLLRYHLWLFGFVLQFNPVTSVWHLPIARLSDAVAMLTAVAGLVLGIRYARRDAIVLVGVTVLLAGTCLALKYEVRQGDTYPLLMFTAYLVSAYGLILASRLNVKTLNAFCLGTAIGFCFASVIQLVQATGLDLSPVGLMVPRQFLIDAGTVLDKPGGLWAQGNESGHVYALAAAAFAHLAYRKRLITIYLLYIVLLFATFLVTKNRGGLIGPAILALMMAAQPRRFVDYRGIIVGLLFIILAGYEIADLAGDAFGISTIVSERSIGDTNIDRNVSERFDSNIASARLAAEFPFGLGYRQSRIEMYRLVRLPSYHNAFASIVFEVGIGALLLFVLGLFRNFATKRTQFFFRASAFLVICSGAFEGLFRNPTYMFATCLIIAIGVAGTYPAQARLIHRSGTNRKPRRH